MHYKRLISTTLVLSLIFQTSFAFANERQANMITESSIIFNNFDYSDFQSNKELDFSKQAENFAIIKEENSLNFSIDTGKDISIDFILENSEFLIKEKSNEISTFNIKSPDNKKFETLKTLYDEILFTFEFYGNVSKDDYDNFRWSILYNLIKYSYIYSTLSENSGVDDEITEKELEVTANIILNIKDENIDDERNEISEERLENILCIFYSNLEAMVNSNYINFIEFVDKKPDIPLEVNKTTPTGNSETEGHEIVKNEIELVDSLSSLSKTEKTPYKEYVNNWDNRVNNNIHTTINSNTEIKNSLTDNLKNKESVYISFKDGIFKPIGIVITDKKVDFEKEKKILISIKNILKEKNTPNISCIADSDKLMISAEGKLFISELSIDYKGSDEIKEFYDPAGIELVFKSN